MSFTPAPLRTKGLNGSDPPLPEAEAAFDAGWAGEWVPKPTPATKDEAAALWHRLHAQASQPQPLTLCPLQSMQVIDYQLPVLRSNSQLNSQLPHQLCSI